MGQSAVFGYLLWTVAKDLVKRFELCRSILLCTMGHSAKPISRAQNNTPVFKNLPYPLKGQ
jgi:hypothetical protein